MPANTREAILSYLEAAEKEGTSIPEAAELAILRSPSVDTTRRAPQPLRRSGRPRTSTPYRTRAAVHADSVEVLRLDTRDHALDAGEEAYDLLEYATGLFLTGGSQLKFSSSLGGTSFASIIRRRHAAGMVVAGTSAGAAVLSEHMIALGDGGPTPRRRLVHMAPRLGLAPNMVIDQHFRRRDRLGRLLTALSYNPGPLGVGIDEDTAAVIAPDGILTVMGGGAVTVVDGIAMRYTNSHAVLRGQPISMMGLKIDVLTAGCRYDLDRRVGIPPAETVRIDPLIEEELAEKEELEEVAAWRDDGD